LPLDLPLLAPFCQAQPSPPLAFVPLSEEEQVCMYAKQRDGELLACIYKYINVQTIRPSWMFCRCCSSILLFLNLDINVFKIKLLSLQW